MRKILVCITSPIHIRNFIDSGVIPYLSNENQLDLVITRDISLTAAQERCFNEIHCVQTEDKSPSLENVFKVYSIRYKKLSKSFGYRNWRQNPPLYFLVLGNIYRRFRRAEQKEGATETTYEPINRSFPPSVSGSKRVIPQLADRISKRLTFILLNCYASKALFPLYRYRYQLRYNPSIEMRNILTKKNYDLIIYVSAAYEKMAIDLAMLGREFSTKTLFLIDNWDNLSSKTVLWVKPDFIATWGQQSTEHAISIQGMEKQRVVNLGCARFDHFFTLRNQIAHSHFNFSYVLFLGTALEFDELAVLEVLNLLTKTPNSKIFNFKIIYRPHPWRMGQANSGYRRLENVLMDPQVEQSYLKGDFLPKNSMPDLNYFPGLISNADLVIGGLTSMLLESCVFGKKIIALAHKEKFSVTSPHRVWKSYRHFDELDRFTNIELLENLENLNKLVDKFMVATTQSQSEIDSILKYFVHFDETSYEERLRRLIREICL
jgi:hypothetical protein